MRSPAVKTRCSFAFGLALGTVACLALRCATGGDDERGAERDLAEGTIADPFIEAPESLGKNGADDKFVIRSAVGDREYSIEIPGAARDYDVQVPLAELGEKDADVAAGKKPRRLASPVATDKEMVAGLPRLDNERPADTALLDSAFGTGPEGGPGESPSYTLGLANINDYYKKHQYEYALVELNSLLGFYPNSPQLNKMKGTVLIKMRNYPLAEQAWIKALELDPRDRAVRAALGRLQKRLAATGPGQAAPAPAAAASGPPASPALGH